MRNKVLHTPRSTVFPPNQAAYSMWRKPVRIHSHEVQTRRPYHALYIPYNVPKPPADPFHF